ncbi:MAG: hypothetical protein Q8K31_05605 [Burkholderiaceae bacterium]|nr:hypothetical protein [Burkholderiaceae bacterium]MDP1968644.1 hypothetical protein [Burkholderiaceae bacterium]
MRELTVDEMICVAGGCAVNNGWGNGDQNAPGNSLTHNKAENNVVRGASQNVKGTPANPYSNGDGCGSYLPSDNPRE